MDRFVEVVLPAPVDRAFTYRVPAALAARAQPGMRAVVPVQRRIETGYVVAVPQTCGVPGVKEVLDLPDDAPAFDAVLLKLCRWIADYYCCAWGEALHCALPAGLKSAARMRYRAAGGVPAGRLGPAQAAALEALRARGALTAPQLAKAVGGGAQAALQGLLKRGLAVAEPDLDAGGVSIATETWVRVCEAAAPQGEALEAMQRRAPMQAAVYLDLLHGAPERTAADLYAKHGANSGALLALERKGLIERFERECYRRPDLEAHAAAAPRHTLNVEQQAALDAIAEAVEGGRFATFLLHGITGSGKTEVYLRAIEQVLAQGRDAIILVPEISLTPQTVGRFYARFKQEIAVLHSGLGAGERYDEWRRAQRGEVRIVVGARSAVFAPLKRLGMIVVDEEHDTSYKQGETPRYHARDVAIVRARECGAVCVLGSATPSVESAYNAQTGKSRRLELPSRAAAAALPEVEIVDMRGEMRETSGKVVLSRVLEEAIADRVAAGEQAILLLNRRGFAPYVLCPMCGWIAECPHCQVSLTYHRQGSALRCHHCNHREPQPAVCGKCHFNPLIYVGAGTQKIEEYLQQAFPAARIARMDADTTAGKGGHAKILGRFAAGEIDLLVGTQMLAKGHDYPGVTLVGVVNADTGLAIPDFRAAEQTFQLLTQVAGRAGRGARPGRVYIQTCRPKHYAIAAAAAHDYAAFFAHEIEHRRGAGYPPFRRMAHFMVESADPLLAERHAVLMRRILREQLEALHLGDIELLGPSPSAILKMQNRYRWNLAALSRSAGRLNALARAARGAFEAQAPRSKVALKLDLDPYGAY